MIINQTAATTNNPKRADERRRACMIFAFSASNHRVFPVGIVYAMNRITACRIKKLFRLRGLRFLFKAVPQMLCQAVTTGTIRLQDAFPGLA
jgi:hypothetical protein